MKRVLFSIAALLISSISFAQTFGGYNVAAPEARRPIAVEQGVVIDVLPVEIEVPASADARTTGALVGGLAGAAAGSRGNNWGRAGALGVLGAIAGDQVARRVSESKRSGQQVVVKLASGRALAINQEGQMDSLRQGDQVFVMFGDTTRVVRSNGAIAESRMPVMQPATVPAYNGYEQQANSAFYQQLANIARR